MNFSLQDMIDHPVQTFLYIVGTLIVTVLLGGPATAMRAKFVSRAKADGAAARTDIDSETLEQSNVRRSDTMMGAWAALADRETAKAEQARKERDEAVKAAGEEIHRIKNDAQTEIGRVTMEALASIRAADERATNFESRAVLAEARASAAEDQVQRLMGEVARLGRRLDRLTGTASDIGVDIP